MADAPDTPEPKPNPVQELSDHPNFKVSWANRRRLINHSLMFCGAVILMILAFCGVSLGFGRDIQANMTSIFSTMISSVLFFSMTVIGSYVFGASWESNNYRQKIVDLATSLMDR